jgi:3-carboxy-cis,cis-muconate cycloisomerase
MAQDHERGTGPWQAEPLAIGQAFNLAHGAVVQARFLAEGLVVDPARMQRNLASTGGLIVAEQVMMGLAPLLGRGEAHHLVNRACDAALSRNIPLEEALLAEQEVLARIEPAQVKALCNPENYLGSAMAFVDRVLNSAAARR